MTPRIMIMEINSDAAITMYDMAINALLSISLEGDRPFSLFSCVKGAKLKM